MARTLSGDGEVGGGGRGWNARGCEDQRDALLDSEPVFDRREFEAVTAATGPALGEFADVLVRAGTGWLIRERMATLAARVRPDGG